MLCEIYVLGSFRPSIVMKMVYYHVLLSFGSSCEVSGQYCRVFSQKGYSAPVSAGSGSDGPVRHIHGQSFSLSLKLENAKNSCMKVEDDLVAYSLSFKVDFNHKMLLTKDLEQDDID
uniref:Uncharacterized protein n=1 Tax=Tanacetum cinerariifolium TaxID=118510 RepID=A0A6L2L5F3_TANCI|nr:hypothetical protein [Tanacetum cinerariifolium]